MMLSELSTKIHLNTVDFGHHFNDEMPNQNVGLQVDHLYGLSPWTPVNWSFVTGRAPWWGYRNHPLVDNCSTSLVTWVCLTNFEQTGHRAGTSSSGLWGLWFFMRFSICFPYTEWPWPWEPLPTYRGLGATFLVPPQELREARKREEQYQELLTLGFP